MAPLEATNNATVGQRARETMRLLRKVLYSFKGLSGAPSTMNL